MSPFRLFFCIRTTDKDYVRELMTTLGKTLPEEYPIVDATTEVPYGDDWQREATKVLESCSGVVCLIGESTHASKPVDWELREALKLGKPVVVSTLSPSFAVPLACQEHKLKPDSWNAPKMVRRIVDLMVPHALLPAADGRAAPAAPDLIWNHYNLMVQSWENMVSRRQTVNNFYLTACSALLGGIGLMLSSMDKLGQLWTLVGVVILAFLGTALGRNWRKTIVSYGTLSAAKARVVTELERHLPARLFATEWLVQSTNNYTSTTKVETRTAVFFLVLFICLFLGAGTICIWQVIHS